MLLSIALTLALILFTAHLGSVALYLRRLASSKSQPCAIGLPFVTLLRPVCGRDSFDVETLASSFTQDYPDYEVIFCAPSQTDAAVPVVRALIDAYPQVSARLLIGQKNYTVNPKLNNLWKGWQAANSNWVCMSDSNLLLPPHYLRTVVSTWGARTGLVSCPAIGMSPQGFAGSLECAFLNSNQARIQFSADSLGIGFAQGKTLFWNRDVLDKSGGLAALGTHLAEDVCATKFVRANGLSVSLTPLPFAQPIGRRRLRDVWERQLRWSRVRRDGFPWLFASEIANGPMLGLLALMAAGSLLLYPTWIVLIYLSFWYGAEVFLMRRAGWPARSLDFMALPLRDCLLPILWVTTYLRRDIEWRGTAMHRPKVDEHPRLTADSAV